MLKSVSSSLLLVCLGGSFTALIALGGACGGDETNSSNSGGSGPSTSTGVAGSSSTSGTGGSAGGGGTGGGPIQTVDCSPASGAQGGLKLTQVVAGLQRPVLIKNAPGDLTRLFILEQPGRIRLLKNGVLEATPFLDITNLVQDGGNEQGLLGLAFHPNYPQNGRFFVHYSDVSNGGDTKIEEYRRGASDDLADPTPVGTVFTLNQPFSNHNGGSIEFSPGDNPNFLYVFLGDGGSGGDPQNNAQNTGSLLGKILRLDITSLPYSNPAGNLMGSEIWDLGVRNPWRASFDACTGDLYFGDVGQDSIEEIDIEPADSGNRNYGWRIMEGTQCFNPPMGCDPTGLTLPVAEYAQNNGRCSVTGGYVYRGPAISWLRGTYFYGDYCTGDIWTLTYANGMASAPQNITGMIGSAGINISSFGQDAAGEVYVVDLGGAIFRIDPM